MRESRWSQATIRISISENIFTFEKWKDRDKRQVKSKFTVFDGLKLAFFFLYSIIFIDRESDKKNIQLVDQTRIEIWQSLRNPTHVYMCRVPYEQKERSSTSVVSLIRFFMENGIYLLIESDGLFDMYDFHFENDKESCCFLSIEIYTDVVTQFQLPPYVTFCQRLCFGQAALGWLRHWLTTNSQLFNVSVFAHFTSAFAVLLNIDAHCTHVRDVWWKSNLIQCN